MAGRPKLRTRQKMSVMHKGVLIVAGSSILGMMAYLTVFVNTTNVTETKASANRNMMAGYDVGNGEIISAFDFNGTDILTANTGPDAVAVSPTATIGEGGADNSTGLAAGTDKSDINLVMPSDVRLNTDGIDMSLDFKRMEESANFFTRGKYFNFGMKKGKLTIAYRINLEKGNTSSISENVNYEVPQDDDFRNYRFIYNPNTGKGEIFVNGVAVWNHQGPKEKSLYWKSSDNLIIADGMNGEGSGKPILDNIVVKGTSHVNEMPVTLLSFQAQAKDNYAMITWFTSMEAGIDSFCIQRSPDAINFTEIGCVGATGHSDNLKAYAFVDQQPVDGQVSYYRLMATNKPVKSTSVALMGYRFRKDHIENQDPQVVSAQNEQH